MQTDLIREKPLATKAKIARRYRYISFLLSSRSRPGHTKASGTAPKSEAVSRSALSGGPAGFRRASRADPQGRILTGGADKAERRRAPGAVRPLGRQAPQCPAVTAA